MITLSVSDFLYLLLVRTCEIHFNFVLVVVHDVQCEWALLAKEFMTLYLSGHLLAPFKQNPKLVGLTYTCVYDLAAS